MKDKKNIIIIIIAAVAMCSLIAAIVIITGGFFGGPDNETTTAETTTAEPTVEDYYGLFSTYKDAGDIAKALDYAYMYLEESEDEALLKEMYVMVADLYVEHGNFSAAAKLLLESSIEGIYDSYCENNTDLDKYDGYFIDEKNEEYVYIGNYPQTGYAQDELPEYVVNATFNNDGYAKVYGVEYIRMGEDNNYTYYVYEPVRWWIIGEDEASYFLLSDMIVDCMPFHKSFTAATWDVSDLRNWMNDEFYNTCFSESEKAFVAEHHTPKSDNYYRNFFSGEDSYNFVSCISAADLTNGKYVFEGHSEDSVTALRMAAGTDYAVAKGLRVHDNNYARWWTGTTADTASIYTVVITEKGYVLIESGGEVNTKNDIGVRPFITISKEVSDAAN